MRALRFFKSIVIIAAAPIALAAVILLYPIWWLFAKMVDLFGLPSLRSDKGSVKTPVVFYEHPVTRKKVVFVATIHIGEPAYYAALQARIDALVGYRILFEGIGNSSQAEEHAFSEAEGRTADQFRTVFGIMHKLGDLLELQSQKEGLAYPPTWTNTDMDFPDLVRKFVREGVFIFKKDKVELPSLDDKDLEHSALILRWSLNAVFKRFAPLALVAFLTASFSRRKRKIRRIILEDRNEIAFQGVTEHLPEADVATIWGAAHFSGVDKRLRRAGFREVSREWFTVYHVRDYALSGIFGKSLRVSREAARAAAAADKERKV